MPITKSPDAPSQVNYIVTTVGTETAAATAVVVLRIIVKLRMTKAALWWDDWLMVFGIIGVIIHAALLFGKLQYGFGYHLYDIHPEVEYWRGVKLFYVARIFYPVIVGFVKMSILFFYLRLARNLRIYIYVLMGIVTSSYIACTLVAIFQCTPIPSEWFPERYPNAHYINRTAYFNGIAGLNIVTDIIIYVLPIKTLWSVQIPKKQRIGLVLVFALGAFVVVTSFLRLDSLKTAAITKDPTWDNVASCIWTETECNVGIVCACLPYLKPLFMRALGHKGGSTVKSTTGISSMHGGVIDHEFQRMQHERTNSRSSVQGGGFEAYEAKAMGSVTVGTNDSAERITEGIKGDEEHGGIRKTTIVDVTHH